MDFEYSPHSSAGGTIHLLSPNHPQIAVDPFPSIKQIRRSLSRSPSKAPRFQLHAATRSSPRNLSSVSHSTSLTPRSASAEVSSCTPKFSVRRTAPIKSLSRRQASNEPVKNSSSTSNSDTLPDSTQALAHNNKASCTPEQVAVGMRFELDSEPIKFELLKAHAEKPTNLSDAFKDYLVPAKSSPLKRSDGVMNLDQPNWESPIAKRRSLALGSDFDIFDQGLESAPSTANSRRRNSTNTPPTNDTHQPTQHPRSPQRRPFSLRRSTLQQRVSGHPIKPRTNLEDSETPPSPATNLNVTPAMPRTRSRISLDSVLPVRSLDASPQPAQRQHKVATGITQPHPLSKALSPSSSASSLADEPNKVADPQQAPVLPATRPLTRANLAFSRSLPIGALRPRPPFSDLTMEGSADFETPDAYKSAKPLPAAFMSTGLISKRNRNIDIQPGSFGSSLSMPDTPSKKTSLPVEATTPARRHHLGRFAQPRHEFGSPTTPFSPQAFKSSPESFGKGVGIFGSKVTQGRLLRRSSFLSIEGDDAINSPTAKTETVMTADELPPTPTKATHVAPRPATKQKGNSLRSSLLGRRSLAPDLFVAPEKAAAIDDKQTANNNAVPLALTPHHTGPDDSANNSLTPFITFTPSVGNTSPSLGRSRGQRLPLRERSPSPLSQRAPVLCVSTSSTSDAQSSSLVQTPVDATFDSSITLKDSFTPPDASRLSISGEHGLKNTNGNNLPPATPTGPRDHSFGFSSSLAASTSAFFDNDVDTTLTARFGNVQVYGSGEFSIVYRVSNPLPDGPAARLQSPRSVGRVWAVKKTKKPYAGSKDRSRKMREVKILNALRGSEHIVESFDTWEMKNHLYIQTEFCEHGNLKDFLTRTGYKARLDDFRIWKIFLEISQGLKSIHDAGYIHLDLKPANVFIDWEGVLKIGDFGMASTWPAPPHLDGEGDREYIAPEVLSGRFDKPADVFAMGMIMLEIAGNIVLPDNGSSWQRLRAGDMSDLPSLTFSTDSNLVRDESGDPVKMLNKNRKDDDDDSIAMVDDDDDIDLGFGPKTTADESNTTSRPHELVQPPTFMVDPENAEALDRLVQSLISPDPSVRPEVDRVLASGALQWVAERRRAGATVYEGNWGPADDVLGGSGDVEMTDL